MIKWFNNLNKNVKAFIGFWLIFKGNFKTFKDEKFNIGNLNKYSICAVRARTERI